MHAHLGHHLDDARAANACDARLRDSCVKAVLIRPQIRTDNFEARQLGNGINLDPFNGTGGRTLAGTDLRALKGGTCGGGAGENFFTIAKQDFRIGAHVHDQYKIVRQMRAFGQGNSRGIRTNMPRNAGQDVDACTLVDVEVKVTTTHPQGIRGRKGKGCLAQLKGINAEKKVVHNRITDKDSVHNQLLVDLCLGGELYKQTAHTFTHSERHFLGTRGVHHGIAHAAHQIFAKADLRVHHT